MIKELFLAVLGNYASERQAYKRLLLERSEMKRSGELDPNSSASLLDYLTAQLLIRELPKSIGNSSKLSNSYLVKGSTGQGNMAEVPHVCVFDKDITTSAQHGYYIVYLFDISNQSIHLSLNQGFIEYQKNFGNKEAKKKVRENANSAERLLRSVQGFNIGAIDMAVKGDLGVGYKLGSICHKTYIKNHFPEDSEIIDDLRNLTGIYRELKGLVGKSILEIEGHQTEIDFQQAIQSKRGSTPPPGPVVKKESRITFNAKKNINRNGSFSAQALINASYLCENNNTHETFLTPDGHPFVEAHHFIPLEFENDFEFSLDVPENIISLCPTCHRAFHHSSEDIKNELIEKFFILRNQQLRQRGLITSIEGLKTLYKKDA